MIVYGSPVVTLLLAHNPTSLGRRILLTQRRSYWGIEWGSSVLSPRTGRFIDVALDDTL